MTDIDNGPDCKLCEGTGKTKIGNLLLSDPPQPMLEQDCPLCNGTGHFRGRMKALVECIKTMSDQDSATKVTWMKSYIHEGSTNKKIAIEVWHEVMGKDFPCLLTEDPPKKKAIRSKTPKPRKSDEGGQYDGLYTG